MPRIAIVRSLLTIAVSALLASAAQAQNRPLKPPADPCAPIGKTADGKLVYSLACNAIPVVTAPAKPNEAAPPPAAAQEDDPGGLFRNPFPSIIRPTNIQREPGVGPAGGGR